MTKKDIETKEKEKKMDKYINDSLEPSTLESLDTTNFRSDDTEVESKKLKIRISKETRNIATKKKKDQVQEIIEETWPQFFKNTIVNLLYIPVNLIKKPYKWYIGK